MTIDPEGLIAVSVWCIIALGAGGVALVGLGGALADREYLKEQGLNGHRQIVADGNIRSQAVKAIVNLLFLLLGLLALVDVSWRVSFARWGLVCASALMLADSVMEWIDRRRNIALLIREQRRKEEQHDISE